MNNFRTRPNLSNLQFRQIEGTTLDLSGTTILRTGEIRIKENGDLVLEGPIQSHMPAQGHSIVAADEHNVLYKTQIDFDGIGFIIYQPDHGFDVGHVVGFEEEPDVGMGKYTKAIANESYNGEPIGLASRIIDDDTFELTQVGFVDLVASGLYVENSFEAGRVYYLSDQYYGMMNLGPPSNLDSIRKPVFLPILKNEDNRTNLGWVLPYPPYRYKDFILKTITSFYGDGETRDFPFLVHDLETRDVNVQIYRFDEPYSTIYAKVDRFQHTAPGNVNSITVRFTIPPSDGVEYVAMISAG